MKQEAKTMIMVALILILIVAPALYAYVVTEPKIEVYVMSRKPEPRYSHFAVFPKNQTEIWIKRIIRPSEFLFVKIIDEMNITNTRERPFSALQVYYSRQFWEKISRVRIFGSYAGDRFRLIDYEVNFKSGDYVGIAVYFYTYLDKYVPARKNTFRIRLILESNNLLEVIPHKDGVGIQMNISPCPFVPYYVKRLLVRLLPPEDANPDEKQLSPLDYTRVGRNISYKKEGIPPMNFSLSLKKQLDWYKFGQNIRIVWTTKTPPPVVPYVRRTIEITQSFRVKVRDEMSVSICSAEVPAESPRDIKWKLSTLRVGLAKNVTKIIKIEDNIGKLSYSNVTDDDIPSEIKTIQINMSSRPIVIGEVRNISIEYEVKIGEEFLLENNTFSLPMPFAPMLNTTILLYTLRIKTCVPLKVAVPKKYFSVGESRSVEMFLVLKYITKKMSFRDVYPSFNKQIKLLFRYDTLQFIRPFAVLLLYVTLGAMLVAEVGLASRAILRRVVVPPERKGDEDLERFIKAYETIIAYDKRTWADAYESMIIRRPSTGFVEEFRRRCTYIGKQYEKLLPLISELRGDVELYDYLVDLETIEERLNVIKQIIVSILTDFVAGKMDPTVYKLRAEALLLELKDYLNARERIINTIRDIYLTRK